MARYTEAKCRLCRSVGEKLFIKGVRCTMEKCAFARRPTPPGVPKRRRSKPTNYALQLREKQKVKRVYGVLERQFRRFFNMASKSKGMTGSVLIQLLEQRLDNVVFRSLLAASRNQARQYVCHGNVKIDGKTVSIPSYIVRQGQTITIAGTEKLKDQVKDSLEVSAKTRSVSPWLSLNKDTYAITVDRLPLRDDVS